MADRARTIAPTAAALVAAVRDCDRDKIDHLLLAPELDVLALAVVLASWAEPGRMPNGAVPVLTDAERRAAHAAHERGEKSAWIEYGEREYQRLAKRRQPTRWGDDGAPLDLTLEGRWVKGKAGVMEWVADEAEAS